MSQSQNAFLRVMLRLSGAAQYNAQMQATAASTARLGAATQVMGRRMQTAEVRSRALSVGIGLLHRASRLLGYTFGTLAVTGVGWGLKFNSTVEQATLAINRFTHNVARTHAIVNQMLTLATHSPFKFSDLITSTRQLMAFNVSAQNTQRYMPILADAISSVGGSAGQMHDKFQRAVKAIGEINTSGILYRRQLNMLTMLGIPAAEIIKEQMGLSDKAMAQIGKVGISSQDALQALFRGMEQRYHGAALAFGRTMTGRINALVHYAQIMMGTLTKPLYDEIRNRLLPAVTELARNITEAYKAGGWRGVQDMLAKQYLSWLPLNDIIKHVRDDFRNFWKVLTQSVLPALWSFRYVLLVLIAPLFAVEQLLRLMADHPGITQFMMTVILGFWLTWKAYLIVWNAVALVTRARLFMLELSTGNVAKETAGATAATFLYSAALAAWAWGADVAAAATMVLNGELAVMDALLLTNPLVWLAIGIVLLVVGLVILYKKWGWFHHAVYTTFIWLKNHWKLVLEILTWPFGGAIVFIISNWGDIIDFFEHFGTNMRRIGRKMWNWIKDPFNSVIKWIIDRWNTVADATSFSIDVFGHKVEFGGLPHIGGGSDDRGPVGPGSSPVGGGVGTAPILPPEFAPSPGPRGVPAAVARHAHAGDSVQHIHVHVDGKEVAVAVNRANRNKRARK